VTVLAKYQRLEAEGIWSPEPQAQRRDVIVSIGDATITISDFNGTALTHWSLPAMERLNPGDTPALFGPGGDASDTLEIADTEMISALEKVLKAIRRGTPRPGRLRMLTTFSVALVIVLVAVFWVPGAITRHTASLVPEAVRAAIGTKLLSDVQVVAGAACANPSGQRALSKLEQRLFPDRSTPLVVLPSTLESTAYVPGGTILISNTLVEDHETPEVLAGYLVAEDLRRDRLDPFALLLDAAGLRAALGLLSKGRLTDQAMDRMAEWLVAHKPKKVPDAELMLRLRTKGIPGTAYAYAVDISGETTGILIEDTTTATPAILDDGDWIALQRICED